MSDEATIHRALAEPRRRQVLDLLREAGEPLGAATLADRLGLHVNTVRWHLGVLADAGLVTSRTLAHTRPGRPSIGYSAGIGAAGAGESYRLLATMLAGAVDSGESAVETGRAWGRYLVGAPEPFTTESDPIGRVVTLLDEQGFAPERAGAEVRMRRCPFHDLAATHGRVVCGLHRGLVDGALAGLGAETRVASLDAFVEPDLCVARLADASAG